MPMSGLDSYLTPPDPIEVEADLQCDECEKDVTVTVYTISGQIDWRCPECGHDNDGWLDDDE